MVESVSSEVERDEGDMRRVHGLKRNTGGADLEVSLLNQFTGSLENLNV